MFNRFRSALLLPFVLLIGCGQSSDSKPGGLPADQKPQGSKQTSNRYDEPWDNDPQPSKNLKADIALMWKTVPEPDFPVSPVSSINASARVFKAIDLIGKTRKEVIALIGDNRTSSDSGYNFPFYPVPNGTMVYRFDCGSGGWQYNITFDESKKVKSVETRGIE